MLSAQNTQLTKAVAIIPAAGSGQRMGLSESKLLCLLSGKSIFQRTIEALVKSEFFERIVVPSRSSDHDIFKKSIEYLEFEVDFIEGGASRQKSVKAATDFLEQIYGCSSEIIVVVHDAARCFVSKDLLKTCVESAREYGAVTATTPCVDTIYKFDNDSRIEHPLLERSSLKAIQTPQAFKFNLLSKAHSTLLSECSDDAGLVSRLHPVLAVEGEISNFKITTKEDLDRAQVLLNSRKDYS